MFFKSKRDQLNREKMVQKISSFILFLNRKRAFLVSFFFHSLLLAFLFFSPFFKTKPPLKIVDVHLLPPMQVIPVAAAPETAPSPPPPEIKKEVKQSIVIAKPKKKIKKKKIKKKVKKVSIEEIRKQIEKKLKKVESQTEKKFAKKKIGLQGVSTSQFFPHRGYLVGLQAKITESWAVPPLFGALNKPTASVSFILDLQGNLKEVLIDSSSGMEMFDQSVIQAIRAAAPFLPLPKEYEKKELNITIEFQVASS